MIPSLSCLPVKVGQYLKIDSIKAKGWKPQGNEWGDLIVKSVDKKKKKDKVMWVFDAATHWELMNIQGVKLIRIEKTEDEYAEYVLRKLKI